VKVASEIYRKFVQNISYQLPLLFTKEIAEQTHLALWNIAEDEHFFTQKMTLTEPETERLGQIKGGRRLEWLAGRWLIHEMSGAAERLICAADKYGKPHLVNSPLEMSLSHSNEVAAAILSPHSVGIDVQKLVAKIERIAHKYMRESESESLGKHRIEHLHVYWGAKEALYKAYGRRELDFRQHILIEPFDYQENGTTTGRVVKGDFEANYRIYFEKMGEYMLVYAIEN